MKLKLAVRGMLRMCPEAWGLFIRSLQLCCVLLFGALMLLIGWDGQMLERGALYHTAVAFNETAQAVLLLGILLPVLIEAAQDS